MSKLIIFVHTCEKYEETRAKIIQNTWACNRDNVIFITDNKNSTLKKHIYIGEYKKGPTYHPYTVIKMFYLFMNNFNNYDFFMIIDDDSYLYIDKLLNYLTFFDKDDKYMIGDFLNWIEYHNGFKCDYNYWIGGGSGIVFSKKCIEEYLDLAKKNSNIYLQNHDVWLNDLYNLSNKMIKRVHCPAFYQYIPKKLLENNCYYDNNVISVHLGRNMEYINHFHHP